VRFADDREAGVTIRKARSVSKGSPSGRAKSQLAIVKYCDHLLFRNVHKVPRPCVRETVGWIVDNSPDHIEVLWDRSVEELPHEKTQDRFSGITILKSAVVGIERLCPFGTHALGTQRGRGRRHG
jgi:hypothetical protein